MPIYKENEYIECEDYCILRVLSKKYGKFDFLIDKHNIEKCKMYHWNISKYYGKSSGDYFYASSDKNKVSLHRYLTDAPKGKVVDHINGNTLDNRISNLQICNHNENIMKSKKRTDNVSGHQGVHWFTKTSKWMAYININKKRKHLGYFNTYEEALEARLNAEKEYWGKFKPIN